MMDTIHDKNNNSIEMILSQADAGNLLWVNSNNATNSNTQIFPSSPTPAITAPISAPSWELGNILQYDESSDSYTVAVFAVDSKGCYQEKAIQINESVAPFKTPQSDQVLLIKKINSHPTNATHFLDMEDLCSMNQLHEAPLLHCLMRRFFQDKIYTMTGDVLIAVNPYKLIPNLYGNPLMHLDIPGAQGQDEDDEQDAAASAPHVFKIANSALVNLFKGQLDSQDGEWKVKNQSIVVSGESGAGKTEASKRVMSFLIDADREISMSSARDRKARNVDALKSRGDYIRKVLLESNFILEAFGNSKTVRNDNSSRFGKYIKLQYSRDNKVISAYTETFLLEKSRLVTLSANERNYHVLYLLVDRASHHSSLIAEQEHHAAWVDQSFLKQATGTSFRMLCPQPDAAAAATAEKEAPSQANSHGSGHHHFMQLEAALRTVGCRGDELSALWLLLAAILHMSNLTCEGSEESGPVVIAVDSISLENLTEILGVSVELFKRCLTVQRVKMAKRSSITVKTLKVGEVLNNVNALIKWMYSGLFNWLLRKINHAHCSIAEHGGAEAPGKEEEQAAKFIGILDIFGFEILQTNSFEQLCINFTNERLQKQFNEYVFDREQRLYESEGLSWQTIAYRDNQSVIDLISKKPSGLLVVLEQQGLLNRGSSADEAALLAAFNSMHDKKTAAYEKSRFGSDGRFTLKHFAGSVTYQVAGFLDKNNDALQEDLMELMECSGNIFLQNAIVGNKNRGDGVEANAGYVPELPPSKVVSVAVSAASSVLLSPEPSGKKMASTSTVSYQFRNQLELLIQTLTLTAPHYIKCIKPNRFKQAMNFDKSMVLEQLKCSGALEVVRIRQEGFPLSMSFDQFHRRYLALGLQKGWPSQSTREFTRLLCEERLVNGSFQMGTSKLFTRQQALDILHSALEDILDVFAVPIQTAVRRIVAVRRYRLIRSGVSRLQAVVRMRATKRRYLQLLEEQRREKDRIRRERERLELQHQQELELEQRRRQDAELEEQRQKQREQEREQEELLQKQKEREWDEQQRRKEEEERSRLVSSSAAAAVPPPPPPPPPGPPRPLDRQEPLSSFEQRIFRMHDLSAGGDLTALQLHLTQHPEDYIATDPRHSHCGVLHSAARGWQVEVLRHLSPTAMDVVSLLDAEGNNLIHHAAMGGGGADGHGDQVATLRFLLGVLEESEDSNASASSSSASSSSWSSKKMTGRKSTRSSHVSFRFTSSAPSALISHAAYLSRSKETYQSMEKAAQEMMCKTVKRSSLHGTSLNSNTLPSLAQVKGVLKAGWLNKRGESQSWRKRWVVLTHDRLMYFRSDKDKTPRETLSFTGNEQLRVDPVVDLPCAVDIVLTSSQFSLKKRSRVSLMAESERDMRIWACLIRSYAGVDLPDLRSVGTVTEQPPPMKTAAPHVRRTALELCNDLQQSPLHLLCQIPSSCCGGRFSPVPAAAWMLSTGLDRGTVLSQADSAGMLPVHYALLADQPDLAVMLVVFGGHFTLDQVKDEATAKALKERSNALQPRIDSAMLRFGSRPGEGRFLPQQISLRGFSYLTMIFSQQWILDSRYFVDPLDLDCYSLTVTVFNSSHSLAEAVQRQTEPVCLPVRAEGQGQGQCLLWPQAFHMQLPLDIAQQDCYLVASFEKKQYGQVDMLSWCKIPLVLSKVETFVSSTDMNRGDGAEVGQADAPFQRMDFEMIVSKRAILAFD